MTKVIKTTLIAAAMLAGASYAYADNDSGSVPGAADGNDGKGPDVMEKQELLDNNPTGSIVTCDSGTYDANGNCVYVDPEMQQ